jgi:eukaryotic-like serine/threonine-protein kinase
MGGRDARRPDDDMATAADGIAAVRTPSNPSSAPLSSGNSQDSQMTQALFGPDSPTMAPGTPLPPLKGGSAFGSSSGQSLLPVGAVLGQRYEILDVLGQGGMGAVYKALDREVNRTVALKVIRPDLAGNSSIIDRFKQELVLSHQVTHKNVVRIYDIGEADGVKFITMEYIEGKDLRSLILDKKTFPQGEAVETMVQICRALEATHAVGVIHRDMKPQNIMRDQQGRVVVMDFGLARSIESTDGMTQTGAIVGTMEYMSPEQGLGKPLDERSDLYAAGLIFYELLTGLMPYKADSALASLLKRTQERAVPVSQHDPRIPRSLSNMVAKCLEPNVEHRYQRVKEILADLEAWQGKSAAATLGFEASVGPWGRTIPWPAIGIAVAVVVLALTGYLLRDKLFHSEKAAAGPQVSLAILPLRNASGDASLDWMGKSLAEMLRTDVGQSESLHTVAPERLHQILTDLRISPDTELDPSTIRQIAETTSADQVVWGEYVKLGDQIRIDAQLQNLKTGKITSIKAVAPTEKGLINAVDQLAKSVQENLTLSPKAMEEMKAAAFTPSSQSVDALRAYSEGLEFSRQNNDLEAVKRFESATVSDSNFALAYARLAQAYSRLGYGPKAEQYSSKAVDLDANLPPAEKYMIEAASARIQNNFDKALEAYNDLGKLMPQDPQVWSEMAALYESKGTYDKAFEYYSKVLASDPKNLDALLAIGGVQIERGDTQGSFDYLNRALSLAVELGNQQGKANVLQTIGAAYRLTDKLDDALQNLQQAVAIEKQIGDKGGMAFSLRQIADTYKLKGKPEEAAKNYEEALKLETDLGDQVGLGGVLLNYGQLLDSQGKYDHALEVTKRALQIELQLGDEDTQGICLNNIGSIYMEQGKHDEALTYFQRSLELVQKLKVPSDIARSLNNIGEAYLKMGKFDKAMDNYLQALQVSRSAGDKYLVAETSASMAGLFEIQGRNGAALGAQQDALKNMQDLQRQDADSAEIQADYGRVLALVGHFDDAQKNFDGALSLARSLHNDALVGKILNLQGERFFYQGNFTSARSLFDQALQSASHEKDRSQILNVKFNQARLEVQQGHAAAAVSSLKELGKTNDAGSLSYLSLQSSLYLGQALVQLKNYPQAQKELESVLRKAQDQGLKSLLPQAHYWMAMSLRGSGSASEAAAHLQQAQKSLQEMRTESHSDDLIKREDLKVIAQAIPGKAS